MKKGGRVSAPTQEKTRINTSAAQKEGRYPRGKSTKTSDSTFEQERLALRAGERVSRQKENGHEDFVKRRSIGPQKSEQNRENPRELRVEEGSFSEREI